MKTITLPGLIDPHVHLRDPNQSHKEDFYTGTASALAGGYTTIIDMPNNKTPITTLARLQDKITIAKKKIVCDVGFYFGSLGDNLEEFNKVKRYVLGLKLYLNETTGNFLIDKKSLEKIFTTWSQSITLHSAILQNQKPILLHAEDDAVAEVIRIVKKTGQHSHFCHISTISDLKQVIKAKEEGLPITCGVTPHHLFLTEHDAKRLGPYGKMKPPLRSKKDVDFLWKNLKFIDVVESDHAPHTKEEKESDAPPYGVPGLETTLPLLLTAVSEKRLSLDEIIRLCYQSPSRIFGIPRFDGSNHQSAIEIDLDRSYTIENKNLFTKCAWSPFNGWKVKGKILRVVLRRKKVFDTNRITALPAFGKIIH